MSLINLFWRKMGTYDHVLECACALRNMCWEGPVTNPLAPIVVGSVWLQLCGDLFTFLSVVLLVLVCQPVFIHSSLLYKWWIKKLQSMLEQNLWVARLMVEKGFLRVLSFIACFRNWTWLLFYACSLNSCPFLKEDEPRSPEWFEWKVSSRSGLFMGFIFADLIL